MNHEGYRQTKWDSIPLTPSFLILSLSFQPHPRGKPLFPPEQKEGEKREKGETKEKQEERKKCKGGGGTIIPLVSASLSSLLKQDGGLSYSQGVMVSTVLVPLLEPMLELALRREFSRCWSFAHARYAGGLRPRVFIPQCQPLNPILW